jgi:hypothetical protein
VQAYGPGVSERAKIAGGRRAGLALGFPSR